MRIGFAENHLQDKQQTLNDKEGFKHFGDGINLAEKEDMVCPAIDKPNHCQKGKGNFQTCFGFADKEEKDGQQSQINIELQRLQGKVVIPENLQELMHAKRQLHYMFLVGRD